MARFIAVAQLKGGAGKSTLATNLAGYLSREMSTGLIDADQPQCTSASWATLREDSQLKLAAPKSATELVKAAEAMDSACEVVIIDLPPRLHEISRAALVFSDLVIIPISGSAPEIWAAQDMLGLINEARGKAPDLKCRLIWNRYRHSKTAEATAEAINEQLGIPRFNTTLGSRTAYSEAIGRGLTVHEWSDQKAKTEMQSLVSEIRNEVQL